MISAGDIRNGITFELDGKVMQVIEFQHVKPGKGAAFVRVKMKNVITGGVTETSLNPSAKFPTAFIERKKMEYSYNDGSLYYFMDQETYELEPIDASNLDDSFKFVKENDICTVMSYKGKVFGVEVPTLLTWLLPRPSLASLATLLPTLPSPLPLRPALRSRFLSSSTRATRSRSTPVPANTWAVPRSNS